jgi:TRAP-type C4-dicarboxylate transport system permease small subunit
MKNAKFISYSQQTYASMIVKLSLHLKWCYPIMPVFFCLKTKVFFRMTSP